MANEKEKGSATKKVTATWSKIAFGGTVIIEAGPEHKQYHVHKALLTHYSVYFRNAFNGNWKEADEGLVWLEDVEPKTVEGFVDWLYTQQVNTIIDVRGEESSLPADLRLVKAWAFADRFRAPGFRQAVNNAFVNLTKSYPPFYSVIIYVFDNLPTTCGLRKFLVDAHCAMWSKAHDENDHDLELRSQLPLDFWSLAMVRHSEARDDPGLYALDRCSYHEHCSEEEKDQCEAKCKQEDAFKYVSDDESDEE